MDWTIYWFMFPVLICVATTAMLSGIELELNAYKIDKCHYRILDRQQSNINFDLILLG